MQIIQRDQEVFFREVKTAEVTVLECKYMERVSSPGRSAAQVGLVIASIVATPLAPLIFLTDKRELKVYYLKSYNGGVDFIHCNKLADVVRSSPVMYQTVNFESIRVGALDSLIDQLSTSIRNKDYKKSDITNGLPIKEGTYADFWEFRTNSPRSKDVSQFQVTADSILIGDDQNKEELVWGLSKGEEVFVQFSDHKKRVTTKLIHVGRYAVFESLKEKSYFAINLNNGTPFQVNLENLVIIMGSDKELKKRVITNHQDDQALVQLLIEYSKEHVDRLERF